jgi:hypothetical protein
MVGSAMTLPFLVWRADNCYKSQDIIQLKSCDIHNIYAII